MVRWAYRHTLVLSSLSDVLPYTCTCGSDRLPFDDVINWHRAAILLPALRLRDVVDMIFLQESCYILQLGVRDGGCHAYPSTLDPPDFAVTMI